MDPDLSAYSCPMWELLTSFFSIVLVDLVLSGDNALLIGMACARLPEQQRKMGILCGSLAAVLLRFLMAAGAAYLLQVPLLRALGGLLLVWIAYKLTMTDSAGHGDVAQGATLWDAVKTIAVADLVMSMDNVLAVGSLSKGNLGLLIFGLALTIPIIVWGSSLVATLLNRAPWLSYAGAMILAWTAGSMIADDPTLRLSFEHLLPPAAVALVMGASLYERVRMN